MTAREKLRLISGALAAVLILIPTTFSPASNGVSRDYVIGPKDVLDIKVYQQEDLEQQVRVSEEGWIALALIGEVKVTGYTVEETTRLLTAKYKEFIFDPQVSVFIREYHSKQIYVLGEVRKPGVYQLTGNATILDLITQAGGINEEGGETLTIIHRPRAGEEAMPITVNLTKLLESGDQIENIEVEDGDTIYVPRSNYFFVFGEVRKPGSYKFEKDLKITVLKAISLAGGFTDKASKKKIKITREKEGIQQTIKADLGDVILPHDIIIVPESFF